MTIVAEFKIDYRQILDPAGCLVAPLPRFAANPDEVVRMYEAMTRVRVFDTKSVNLQRTGQLGTYPPSLGHEATHIGVGAAMRPEDVLAPVYREFGTQLWRGVTMTEILTYWGGDERGNDFAGPRHDFAWCVPIATQTLHAAGAAMAFKVRREPRCALAYIGDGGTSEGAFYEALTHRLSDHTTADDASRYRSAADVEAAWAVEPLVRLRSYLRGEGVWNDAKEQALLQDCARKVDAAVAEYLRFARPTSDAMFDHLFAALPEHLVEQRATARYYSSSSKLGSSSSKLGSSSSKLGSSKAGASKTSGH